MLKKLGIRILRRQRSRKFDQSSPTSIAGSFGGWCPMEKRECSVQNVANQWYSVYLHFVVPPFDQWNARMYDIARPWGKRYSRLT